ncbi:MAG: glycerol-3-phosphate 1-O-acyltransferase PlsY [Oscillospiraceae bacterium]|jgi:glycerol-3-phosphate acyltransferase PlsY|nr:glycerol-3-phosphate 1-O-acyltransferase PlsY [Oscillospiraceae bacterium]
MADIWRFLLAAVTAYLVGSLNGSLLLSRAFLRDDIRRHGSGNAGATNVLRTYGVKWTVLVSLWDVGKGVLAVWLGQWILPGYGFSSFTRSAVLLAGFCVIAGHVFPVFFGFKGGKGVITACAVFFTLDWQVALISFGVFLLLLLLTRFLSLGSVAAVFTLPILGALFGREWLEIGMYGAVGVLIIILHRENIKRLLRGTENRFPKNKTPA